MKKFTYCLFFMASLLQFSCSSDDDASNPETNSKSMEIGYFTMQVPENFTLENGTGYDSQVGTISGAHIEIRFDYGMYSGPPENTDQENYELKQEDIDGLKRYTLFPKNEEKNNIRFFAKRADNSESNNALGLAMYAENINASQQLTVLAIFNSVTINDTE